MSVCVSPQRTIGATRLVAGLRSPGAGA